MKENLRLNTSNVLRFYPLGFILSPFLIFISSFGQAQETSNQSVKPFRNSAGFYVGLLEFNLNYEWNILQRPKSFSNLRFGLGGWSDMQSGGKYINTSFIHLLGKRKSHIEMDLGMKLVFSGTNLQLESQSTYVMPEVYLGYYLQYGSNDYFRVGFSFPTLFNIGGGIRF